MELQKELRTCVRADLVDRTARPGPGLGMPRELRGRRETCGRDPGFRLA